VNRVRVYLPESLMQHTCPSFPHATLGTDCLQRLSGTQRPLSLLHSWALSASFAMRRNDANYQEVGCMNCITFMQRLNIAITDQ